MDHLQISDLYSLEDYARLRADFRARVLEHKAHRKVALGDHVTLLFEDRLTMHYQIQEMLRAERIFEEAEIVAELEAYNPLIPDGTNWKATMLIEYPDVTERQAALQRLVGIEVAVWVQVAGCDPVYAIADEDLERTSDGKTSAVHFLRFELTETMVSSLKSGAGVTVGCGHPAYSFDSTLGDLVRESLIADLD